MDLNTRAASVVKAATEPKREPSKNEFTGSLGGKARARKLSKAQRSEIARKAARARWDK